MSDKVRAWLQVIGLALGIVGLAFTLCRTYVLEARIVQMEVTRRFNLFSVSDPLPSTTLPSRRDVTIRGAFFDAIPPGYTVKAVVAIGGEFYVLRNDPILVGRQWSIVVWLSPGTWQLYLCLADKKGAAEMDRWASEKTPAGNNPRPRLPDGVYPNTSFEYVAAEAAGSQKGS